MARWRMGAKIVVMPGVILNALFSSFFLVRIVKGSWTRNPHYLAISLIGSIMALLILHAASPGSEDGFIFGNLAAFAGAWAGIMLYDAALGTG